MDKVLKDRILNKLRNSCSRREYCSSDILSKASSALVSAGEPEETVASSAYEILESLTKDGYVDDMRYACAFVRDKSSLTGWGSVKIRYALQAKKLDGEIINAAIQAADPQRSQERLRKIAEAKYRSIKEDPSCRLKLLRFILGRGYSYQEAAPVVDSICRGGQNE